MIYELVMKKSAKELDPRHFDPRERRQFDISDQAEWAQWVNNQVPAFVPPHMEGQVDAKNIMSVPMRYVRTSRGEGGALVAKSRHPMAGPKKAFNYLIV